jgi:hypothetical protein
VARVCASAGFTKVSAMLKVAAAAAPEGRRRKKKREAMRKS